MKLSEGQSITIIINACDFWNDTDIEIEMGDVYLVEATGEWKDIFKKTDADGYSSLYMNLWNKFKRSKDNKWFSLIGSLDKTNYFLIGKNNELSFNQPGKLSCFANDVPGFYWNNSGTVSLEVTRIK